MNKGKLHIDNILKDKLVSFEGNIPLSDWNIIENKLNRRRKLTIAYWSFFTFILLTGSIALFSVLNKNSKTQKPLADNFTVEEKTFEVSTNKEIVSNPEISKNHKKLIKSEINTQKEIIEPEDNYVINFNYLPIDVASINVDELFNFNLPIPERVNDLKINKPATPAKKSNPKLSFEVGVNFSSALGMEAIKENSKMNKFINRSYFNAISGSSTFGNGLNNGINLQVNYGENWFLRSGIYLKEYSVYHSFNYTISEYPTVDVRNGILMYLPTLPETVKYDGKSLLKFVNIPIIIGHRYYFNSSFGLENKIGLNISKFSSGTGKSVNPTYLNLEEYSGDNIRNWSKGYTLSTGVFYKSKRNFIFTLEPNYSSVIGSAYRKEYPVKNRLFNYGLNFNINYILK